MFIVGIHSFFSKLVVYKIPRIRMKLKASVLGSVTRAVLGAGYLVVVVGSYLLTC